jgi:hypothetical protein
MVPKPLVMPRMVPMNKTGLNLQFFYKDKFTSDGSAWVEHLPLHLKVKAGNTKGGSITVPLTSCLTGLESAV